MITLERACNTSPLLQDEFKVFMFCKGFPKAVKAGMQCNVLDETGGPVVTLHAACSILSTEFSVRQKSLLQYYLKT